MNISQIAYVIYLLTMIVNGLILSSAGLSLRDWQSWVIPLTTVIIYLCGYARGKLV